MNPKIKKREEIKKIAEQLKKEGKRIVTTNGTFDMLHYGHVKLLEYAKNQGDILIVGMNSDSSVKKYKGKHRPIIKEKHRAEVLAAIQHVDYVTVFDEETCTIFVESIKPNVHVNAATYGYDCIEKDMVEKNGGRIELFEIIDGHSTTQLIEKIKEVPK